MPTELRRINLMKTGHIATIVVIGVAFLVTIAAYFADLATSQGPPFSGAALVIAIVLGIIYTALLVTGIPTHTPATRSEVKLIYFAILVALMLAIEFLLSGANGIWLISMPLIAAAATDLSPLPRWFVFIAAFAGAVIPTYLLYDDWNAPFFFGLTFITAFVFVLAFVKLTTTAETAQAKAEQLAKQLADANRKLGDFAIQAEELATIQERNRLAREIHDNLGHYLTVVNVQIKAAQTLLLSDPARADDALNKAAQLTQEGLAAVRQSVASLRESPLGNRTLPEAIAALVAETQATGIVTELHVEGVAHPLDPRVELTLFRAAQEGLTNTRKHARASRVDLTLSYLNPMSVSLSISDNGIGALQAQPIHGFGLLGLNERARQLGGEVTISTNPGQGYSLTVVLPTQYEDVSVPQEKD